MRVRVGNIGARCEACGCEEFQPRASANEVACSNCCALIYRRVLLMQIANETVRRAERLLEHSKKQ